MPLETIAVAGLGLIGGSFALALRKAGFAGEIIGVSSPPAVDAAIRLGAISRAVSLEEAAAVADLIYLAQPIDGIIRSVRALSSLIRPDCLVTDAGSTKATIVRTALQYLPSSAFLGGHPLAGKERRGIEAADPDLFRGRCYVLTPQAPGTPVTTEFRSWLSQLGGHIIDMAPSEHDATLAFTSHLPQLLSTALADTLAREPNPHLATVFGPALIDMTRLALSSADLWRPIFATNASEIDSALDAFLTTLANIREAVNTGEVDTPFASAAAFASKIRDSE